MQRIIKIKQNQSSFLVMAPDGAIARQYCSVINQDITSGAFEDVTEDILTKGYAEAKSLLGGNLAGIVTLNGKHMTLHKPQRLLVQVVYSYSNEVETWTNVCGTFDSQRKAKAAKQRLKALNPKMSGDLYLEFVLLNYAEPLEDLY